MTLKFATNLILRALYQPSG